ncbi:MAG: hypothetical protein KatS3mg099_278 [Candidatus Parcubacteria bacterium]|nr:MAG: hypothetical protein KatS3mg099_278 [Candidatus Parcubacteria bacterium]
MRYPANALFAFVKARSGQGRACFLGEKVFPLLGDVAGRFAFGKVADEFVKGAHGARKRVAGGFNALAANSARDGLGISVENGFSEKARERRALFCKARDLPTVKTRKPESVEFALGVSLALNFRAIPLVDQG